MKRYMVFVFYGFYPSGGMNDFERSFDTWEEAQKYIHSDREDGEFVHDFYQIYDRKENKVTKYRADYDDSTELKEIE